MNRSQQIILTLGLLAIAGFCLYPPHQWKHMASVFKPGAHYRVETVRENIGHYWIWKPPAGWDEDPYPMVRKTRVAVVDRPRLGVYLGVTVMLTSAFVFVFRSTPTRKT